MKTIIQDRPEIRKRIAGGTIRDGALMELDANSSISVLFVGNTDMVHTIVEKITITMVVNLNQKNHMNTMNRTIIRGRVKLINRISDSILFVYYRYFNKL